MPHSVKKPRRQPSKRKKPVRKRPAFKFIFFSVIVLASAVFFLSSPLFDVTGVSVTGNSAVSESYILKQGGLVGTFNIFLLSKKNVEQLLKENPYIKSVNVIKNYPNHVTVAVSERKLRGFIEYKGVGTFLHIDETGTVINVTDSITENKPIITGLQYVDFVLGEPIKFENPSAFENIVILDKLFEKYRLDSVLKMDISSGRDIALFIRGIDVAFGDMEDADLKVRWIKAALDEIPEGNSGRLDVSDTKKGEYVFAYYVN